MTLSKPRRVLIAIVATLGALAGYFAYLDQITLAAMATGGIIGLSSKLIDSEEKGDASSQPVS